MFLIVSTLQLFSDVNFIQKLVIQMSLSITFLSN